MPYSDGGSHTTPLDAAKAWIVNIVPLQKKYGIKVGLPATANAAGSKEWLDDFLRTCGDLLGGASHGNQTNCTFDFVSLHHFGGFLDLVSSIGEYRTR